MLQACHLLAGLQAKCGKLSERGEITYAAAGALAAVTSARAVAGVAVAI